MFGGGNGSFGVAQPPNPFGAVAQGSPANPFQGSTNFGGGGRGRGRGNNGGSGFGDDASYGTSFGGRSGGRFGTSSSRGGRTQARGGGRSGGRHTYSYQDDAFGGALPAPYGGGGGGGGASTASGGFDNPFASPAASYGGFDVQPPLPIGGTSFGQAARGGGRTSGRGAGGRATTFGGVGAPQPNVRRKPDFGGRGARAPGTAFGQAGNEPFIPPLPPSSPPSSTFTRKPGRGGIVTPQTSPGLSPATTTFGQQSGGRSMGHAAPSPFPHDASPAAENPFAASSSNAPSRTAFGVPQAPGGGYNTPSARPAREKRTSHAFQQQGFQDGSEEMGGFVARFDGETARANSAFATHQLEGGTTFGREQRRKTPAHIAFGDAASSSITQDDGIGMASTLKPKKKMGRGGTPQSSPPPTPGPSPPAHGQNAGQTIGDQKNKAELASAENLDGTCVDMCSPTERELHIRVDELSLFEKCFPGKPGQERELIVKRFQRSSADHKLDIPSELRPLGVLRFTQLYLEQQIMDREVLGPDPRFATPRTPELIELYNFCWDRFRMIRKDFVLQNYRGAGGRVHPIAVDVHERIARYHILSEHELCEVPSFVAQQNMEQLGQTLKSLNELYDESRKLGDPAYLSPFEAEFRGYFILCTLDNGRGSDVLKFVKGLAPQVREAAQVKFAMQVFVARHTQNYYQFFKLLREATYLQACLVFRYIPSMRSLALERLNRANRNQPYLLVDLADLLCFDDLEHAESVCSHHGLDVSASEDNSGDGEPVVNFGGEFETDIQLRQNKNPLPVRSSHVYVSQKQQGFYRRDVCRGVTEYQSQEYPALSKLIQDTEAHERAALYPDRPVYEDEYSAFAAYRSDPYEVDDRGDTGRVHEQRHEHAGFRDHPRAASFSDSDERQHELGEIAKRQAEVERTKMMMMQRIQQLEREKQEKKLQARQSEAEAAKEREAEEKARAEAEVVRKQRELQDKVRQEKEAELKRKLDHEMELRRQEEAKKAAAEQARLAEQRRLVEEKRRAEEEQRLRELQRIEEERRKQAAVQAERRRQAELAAERERLEREAERQAELARETAYRKQVQRKEKQRLAVLELKFHLWKEFTTRAKATPRDIRVEATTLIDRGHGKPDDVMDWLFGGSRSATDFIGLKRRQLDEISLEGDDYISPPPSFWRPIDVASVIGQAMYGSGHHVQGWKFVVADLLDEGLSSFGSWCAVKYGISSASLEEEERISTVQATHWSDVFSLAVCCRYLDANFLRVSSQRGREKKLSGTSALLLPIDLAHVLDPRKLQRWEERVYNLLAHLHPARRVGVVVLAFCASHTPRKGDALAAAEASIRRLSQYFVNSIAFIDGELVQEDEIVVGEGMDSKIANIVARLATEGFPSEIVEVVNLAEVVDTVVEDALRGKWQATEDEDVTELQSCLHAALWRLRDMLHLPSVIDIDAPIPELQATLSTPAYGWNSREAQQKWDTLFNSLTSHRIIAETAPLPSSKVCEVYFGQVSQLVENLFARVSRANALSTTELKRAVYGLLVPVHDEIVKQGESMIHDASRLLPWRQIFGHIYGAFIETLDEELIYMPTPLLQSLTERPSVEKWSVLAQKGGPHKRRSRNRPSLDAVAQAAAVAFARRELKRAMSDQIVPAEEVAGIKRLRHEIARDRVASQKFKQFLRREVDKWSTADKAFPST